MQRRRRSPYILIRRCTCHLGFLLGSAALGSACWAPQRSDPQTGQYDRLYPNAVSSAVSKRTPSRPQCNLPITAAITSALAAREGRGDGAWPLCKVPSLQPNQSERSSLSLHYASALSAVKMRAVTRGIPPVHGDKLGALMVGPRNGTGGQEWTRVSLLRCEIQNSGAKRTRPLPPTTKLLELTMSKSSPELFCYLINIVIKLELAA